MKAIVYTKYGPPEDVLELKEVEKPTSIPIFPALELSTSANWNK